MSLQGVFNQILILFLILVIGIAAKKFKAVSEGFAKGITDFILNISLPAFIINSMSIKFSSDMLINGGKIFIISIILYGLSILLAVAATRLFKVKDLRKNVFQFTLIFSNVGFMGYPVVQAIYGSRGIFLTAIYNISFTIIVWTAGIIIIDSKKENRISFKNLINSGTISIMIGLIFFVFSIKIPGPIASTLEMIGNMTTPLSMLMVGFILADSSVKQAFSSPMVLIMSMLRLFVIPLIFLMILRPFVSDELLLGLPIIMNAMPAAANTAIFASRYEGDVYTASQCIFVSTFISIVSIPLITFILRSL